MWKRFVTELTLLQKSGWSAYACYVDTAEMSNVGMSNLGWLCLLTGCVISSFGDLLVKKGFWGMGTAVYLISTPFWIILIRNRNLAISAVEWSVIGTMLTVAASRFYLGEPLTIKQILGLVMGLSCLSLM